MARGAQAPPAIWTQVHGLHNANLWRDGALKHRQTTAALYVDSDGVYSKIDGIDIWGVERDARMYPGPHPIVAHPPCQRWGKFWAGQPRYIARTGIRKRKGDDGGCFKSAIFDARRWGGVIEHPWHSSAWPHFRLSVPPRNGGWIQADNFGGYTCCVEQGKYGHYARKPTMLLVYGASRADLPELKWGLSDPTYPPEAVRKHGIEYCRKQGEVALKGGGRDSKPRISTPPEFRDLLIQIASVCQGTGASE